MNKNTFPSLMASLFFVVSHAQNLNESIPISSEVKIGQLDNGLTYYLQNNQKPDDIVELRMVVKLHGTF